VAGVVVSIAKEFVRLVLPIHDVNTGIGVVPGSEHDCNGGEIVLVLVKISGRITVVAVKALIVGRNIVPFKILIPDKDTSARVREIRSTHNFVVFLYYCKSRAKLARA
jgi:hypothetical protein